MEIKEINNYGKEILEHLELKSSPVAVKLIQRKEEIPSGIKRVELAMTHCQFVDRVRRTKEEFYTVEEDQMCEIGAGTLGINNLSPEVLSGESYCKEFKLFNTQGAARRTVERTPVLSPMSTESVLYSPLEKASFIPDVVAVICVPKQIMLLTQAYMYKTGGRLETSFAGTQSFCSESVVQVYKEGKVGITFGCMGSRMYTKLADEELVMGIPVEFVPDIVFGLKAICPK